MIQTLDETGVSVFTDTALAARGPVHAFGYCLLCSGAKAGELSSPDRDRMACKTPIIYNLTLYRKSLPAPCPGLEGW